MSDERVRRLKPIAQQLVGRIHDDDPEANLRWLRSVLGLPTEGLATELEALLFMVGAAVPTEEKFIDLVAWTGEPEVELERRRQTLRESQRRTRRRAQAVDGAVDDGSCGHTPGSDSAGEAA